jgi:glycosyltransferase involved in cell wall biosynthesis
MLCANGHTVFHYGNEASQVVCTEHVSVTTAAELLACYGDRKWVIETYSYRLDDACYRAFFERSIAAIGQRKQSRDFLLCMWGAGHKPVADAHADLIVVEPGIGYGAGHFARWKVFESYALLHAYYGLEPVRTAELMDWYAVVIPNYFDPSDFDFSADKDDYLLFLGRYGRGKGVHIAIEVAQRTGRRLLIAGQDQPAGAKEIPNVEFVGFADSAKRRQLLSRASAIIAPSTFIEPFCGVQVEAMLSGTPVISTDWGAFAECNLHGVTGYRCRTFEQFLWAAEHADRINPRDCREWAKANFSMSRVSTMYEEFFRSVMNVYAGNGWYEPNLERRDLDWLTRYCPQ